MKKILLNLAFLLTISFLYAQQPHFCGTQSPSMEEQLLLEKELQKIKQQRPLNRNEGLTPVPLKIHIVRQTDGSGGLDMLTLNKGIANVNHHFYSAGIEFYICGDIDYIDNSTYYHFNSGVEGGLATEAEEVSNALNLYVPETVSLFGNPVAGYAYLPLANFDNIQATRLFVQRHSFVEEINIAPHGAGVLVHELGHSFALFHPFSGTSSGNDHPDAEHVPRTGPHSNCETAGDYLCDTPADPGYDRDDPTDDTDTYNFIDATCTYIEGQTDIYGNLYAPMVGNVMDYYPIRCGGEFTNGQYGRMADALVFRQQHTSYTLDCPPVAVILPTDLVATQNGNVVELSWTDVADNELGYLIERSTTSATEGFESVLFGGVGPNATSFSDVDRASNVTYWYRIKASNGDANTYSNTVSITTTLVYCLPTNSESSCYAFGAYGASMVDFTLSSGEMDIISNLENGCTGALSDFSGSIAGTVNAGESYDFSIQLSNDGTGSHVPQTVSIWIDTNQNGIFEDSGEKVVSEVNSFNGFITGSFNIPANSLNGTTKMRVRAQFTDGNSVVSCGYIAFSEAEDYTLLIENGVLPLSLTAFTAQRVNHHIQLTWEVEEEKNVHSYQIERSKNGQHFDKIGEQSAFNQQWREYHFEDKTANWEGHYYRLKIIENSGKIDYSETVFVAPVSSSNEIQIFPNPAKDQTRLILLSPIASTVEIKIFNLLGQPIYQLETADSAIDIDMKTWPKGVYFVTLGWNGQQEVFQLVKE